MGIAPDVTPQNAASHLGLFCLLNENSSKNGIKIRISPNTPKTESGLFQIIMMGKSIRQIWVTILVSFVVVSFPPGVNFGIFHGINSWSFYSYVSCEHSRLEFWVIYIYIYIVLKPP